MSAEFRQQMVAGETLVGTFVRTPAHEVLEVLAKSALDFVCLDAEHGPFDRARLDICLAVAKGLGLPALVRVEAARPEAILQALDSGATGIVIPHVDSAEKAADLARLSRYGPGGRGFAGATRWSDFGGASMGELIDKSQAETIVIAQIEEPAGVEAAEAIAATPGIDGLFVGPSDLSVGYGKRDANSPEVAQAYDRVGAACRAAGKALITWVPSRAKAEETRAKGVTMFFVQSEQSWLLSGANAAVAEVKGA